MTTQSPVAVRHPLAQRNVNTPFYTTTTTTTTTTNPSTQKLAFNYKPSLTGNKRSHSQLTNSENIQTHIFGQLTQSQARRSVSDARPKPLPMSHLQFKPPLPKVAVEVKRQRQETHDPRVEEDKELMEWRKSIKRLISASTFYFDGMEEGFKEQATRWIIRFGGVVFN